MPFVYVPLYVKAIDLVASSCQGLAQPDTKGHEDMGIRLIPYKGGYRPYWYAEYRENGRRRQIRLSERVMGTPPKSLSIREEGDTPYERSKARAEAEFETFEAERRRKCDRERLMEELVAAKTGERAVFHRLEDIGRLWNELPREVPLSELRMAGNLRMAKQFADFCGHRYLYEVKASDVKGFGDWLREQGYAWTTIKGRMSFLSGAFNRFNQGGTNPFRQVIRRRNDAESKTIHRNPLTNEQIEALREEARGDELLYPLVECGLATGARLYDIAHMRKDSIDFREGFVTYVASKTGTRCEIPLFDEFRRVCECIVNSSDPDEPYLFPEAAYLYDTNRTGLSYRGKRLFAKALFKDIGEKPEPTDVIDGKPRERRTAAEVYSLIDQRHYKPSKAERMKDIYEMYVVQGKPYRQIEAETRLPRSSIADYMREIERLTGDGLVRFDISRGHIVEKLEQTRVRRSETSRAVSVYGWASLRATFCRLAIERGVDEKMIMLAAGHSNFRTTMTYYDNPTRTHQRELMKARMAATAIGRKAEPTPLAESIHGLVDRLPPELQKALEANLRAVLGDGGEGTVQLPVTA